MDNVKKYFETHITPELKSEEDKDILYFTMKDYTKHEVIKELERMSDIMLLENEHKPIDIRIQELKSMY